MAGVQETQDDMTTSAGCAVTVNGAAMTVRAATLNGLLDELGYGDRRVATAVNGEFVSADARTACVLAAGDRIEVVAPRQGG